MYDIAEATVSILRANTLCTGSRSLSPRATAACPVSTEDILCPCLDDAAYELFFLTFLRCSFFDNSERESECLFEVLLPATGSAALINSPSFDEPK